MEVRSGGGLRLRQYGAADQDDQRCAVQSRKRVQQSASSSIGIELRTELENTDTVSTMAMTVAAMASPRITSSLPFVPHIFSMAGSNTGAEREVSQGRILCAA